MNKLVWIYSLFAIVFIGGVYSLTTINFEADFYGAKLASDKEMERYSELVSVFPTEQESDLIIFEKKSEWNSYTDFLVIDSLTTYLSKVSGLDNIVSITNLELPKKNVFRVYSIPFINLKTSTDFEKSIKKRKGYLDIYQKFLSQNKQYCIIYFQSETELTENTIAEISTLPFLEKDCRVHFYQKNKALKAVEKMVVKESVFLAIICILLLLVAFYVLTKSFAALWLILAFIFFNLFGTVIFMSLADISFTVQMIALPCLVIIFSFTDIMHIFYHQTVLKHEIADTDELIVKLKLELRKPIFLTSLSNLFGFVIFLFLSNNQALTDLAIASIVGILISLWSVWFMVIPLMSVNKNYIQETGIRKGHSIIIGILNKLSRYKKIFIRFIIVLFFSVSILNINMFKIDTFTNNSILLNKKIEETQSILSHHFYGSKTLEISIEFENKMDLWNSPNLIKIEKTEQFLSQLLSPIYCISPSTIVKRFHRININGNADAYVLPKKLTFKNIEQIENGLGMLGGEQIIGNNGKIARIIVGYEDVGLYHSRQNYAKIHSYLDSISTSKIQFKLTGPSFLADEGMFAFTRNVLLGWAIGIALIGLLLSFVLKSGIKGLILILVNTLPLFIVVLLMPFFNLKINPQSIFLLTILAGLCIDDSIYIVLQSNTKTKRIAFFPIIVTSIVLAAGFATFAFSSFSWLTPFCWIFLIGIFIAFILDVFVLPLFIGVE